MICDKIKKIQKPNFIYKSFIIYKTFKLMYYQILKFILFKYFYFIYKIFALFYYGII